MSTASKKDSKKEIKKEIKKEPVQESESEMDHSDMENDKHSIFNGDFKKNPAEAKFFLKHFNAYKSLELFDEDGEAKLLKSAWGESLEALEELVKKNNKREKTKKTKFVPSNIEKPKKPIDIFGKLFSEESKAKGVKFSKDNNYLVCRKTAWDNLSKKEQEKYNKQSQTDFEKYEVEFAKQKAEAITNGEFPEDKIKGPCTAYFLFLAEIRPKLTDKFKDDSDKNTKITKEAAKMWKALSEKDKEKYKSAYRKEKIEFDIKNQEWKTNEIERIKKQEGNGNEPANVKIESSGQKKVEKTEKAKSIITVSESDNTDSEEVEVKSKKTKTKKAKAEKVLEEVIETIEIEVVNEASEEEEVIEKPKAKASKAKATKAK